MTTSHALILQACMATAFTSTPLLRGGEVQLGIQRAADSLEVTATCGTEARRVVWQSRDALASDWITFATGNVTNGAVRVPLRPDGNSLFVRAVPKPTPGFLDRLGTLRGKVLDSWPEAALLEAHLLMQDWFPSYPDALPVRGVFRVDMGTVTAVEATPGGEIEAVFTAMPWLGSQPLEWPIAMEVDVAWSRMFASSFGNLCRALTLRQPVYPGMTEPYWIFRVPDGGFVFVGSRTGTVKRG